MNSPIFKRSDVLKVYDWGAEKFAHWLNTEISVSLENPRGKYPFRPLHYLFVPSMPIWETLTHIALAMDDRCRAEFLSGLSGAIDLLEPTENGFAAFELLLQLVAKTGCVQACDAIVRKVGQQGFGAPTSAKAKLAFEHALITLAGLKPSAKTQAAIENLVASEWLVPDYAPTALVSLARNDADLVRHLDLLRGKFGPVDPKSERLQSMLRELVSVVPFTEIGRQWKALLQHEDEWLFSSLIQTRMKLFEKENGEFGLQRDDGVSTPLKMNPAGKKQEAMLIMKLTKIMDEQTIASIDPSLREEFLP